MPRGGGIDRRAGATVVDQAMATIGEGQSSWRPAELMRELAAAVPTGTQLDADRLVAWLDDVAAEVAATRCVDLSRPVPPGALLRRDGRPVTESADRPGAHHPSRSSIRKPPCSPGPTGGRCTSAAERRRPLATRHATGLTRCRPKPQPRSPAGTTWCWSSGRPAPARPPPLTPAVEQLRADGRVVFGVAPSATAADVLTRETGVAADTVDKLLDRTPAHPAARSSLRPSRRRHGRRR